MKNNKGITLSALVIIIVLLVIFSTFAIYSSVESFKLIDIQKYKAQMQAIQNGLDEIYAQYENDYEKSKATIRNASNPIVAEGSKSFFWEIYLSYLEISKDQSKFDEKIDAWNNNIFKDEKSLVAADQYSKIKKFEDYILWINDNFTVDIEKADGSIDPGNIDSSKLNDTDLIQFSTTQNFMDISSGTSTFWDGVASSMFGIATDENTVKQQYFYLSKENVEELFNIDEIDISEKFIINFQKRYVFSETPTRVVKKGTNPEIEVDLYCLYQLDEEQKVIEYKVDDLGGILKAEIVEKTMYNQTIKLTLQGQDTRIKQVYFIDDVSVAPPSIEAKMELFEEISGLGTEEVYIKIKKEDSNPKTDATDNYKFSAEDFFGGLYSMDGHDAIKIKFHEPPILESNMIPFIATDSGNKGTVYPKTGSENINDWYDYSSYGTNFNNDIKYATAVITTDTSKYSSMKGSSFDIEQDGNFVEGATHIVKVWIPNNMQGLVRGKGYTNIDFIGKTGIWVTAEWKNNKWVPAGNYQINTEITNFSKTQLNINCSSNASNLKYYYKIDDDATMDYTAITGNTIQITARNNLEDEVTSISIYGREANGNMTSVKTLKLGYEDISSAEINLLKDGGFETTGTWKISCTGGYEDASLSYDTTTKRTGNSSLKLIKSKSHGEIAAEHSTQINVDYDHTYYFSAHSYQITNTETYKTIEIFFPIVGGYSDSRSITKNIGKWQRHSWMCKTRSYSSNNIGFRLDYDSPVSSTTSTIYYDDAMLIDLDKLQEYITSKRINLTVSKNKEWCDAHIDTYDGKTILLYEK